MTIFTFMIILLIFCVGAIFLAKFVFTGKAKIVSIIVVVLISMLFIGFIIGIVELKANNVDIEISDTFSDAWSMLKDMLYDKSHNLFD